MNRRALPFLAAALALLVPAVLGQTGNRTSATELRDLQVPMRDGTHLATDVFLPAPGGRFPTVLLRTPYSRHVN